MSTLPGITQSLCIAVARQDWERCRSLALMAAAKMGAPRSLAIENAFTAQELVPVTPLKKWGRVSEPRSPWVPAAVASAISSWLSEVKHADAIVAAGDRVLPLLLVGETRCGKTSVLCRVASDLGLPVNRMSLSGVVESYMGKSASLMKEALDEARNHPGALWLIDEIDAVAFKRGNDGAASQERAHAVGSLLTELDNLPPGLPLSATSNTAGVIDDAVIGRFAVVEFPRWSDLGDGDREAFALSHGFAEEASAGSYAAVVKACRKRRVTKVIAEADADRPLELFVAASAGVA